MEGAASEGRVRLGTSWLRRGLQTPLWGKDHLWFSRSDHQQYTRLTWETSWGSSSPHWPGDRGGVSGGNCRQGLNPPSLPARRLCTSSFTGTHAPHLMRLLAETSVSSWTQDLFTSSPSLCLPSPCFQEDRGDVEWGLGRKSLTPQGYGGRPEKDMLLCDSGSSECSSNRAVRERMTITGPPAWSWAMKGSD